MREIKFRAWNKEDQKPMFDPLQTGLRFELILNAPGIVVMQYTGLKDKDGVDIYEGDILKGYGKEIKRYVVAFTNGSFDLYHEFARWGLLFRMFELNAIPVKVVGNIHENPELL